MLWKPRASYSINSNMQKFLNHIALRYDLPGNDYRTVHGWSIENTKEFWAEIWDYCNVIYSKNYDNFDLNFSFSSSGLAIIRKKSDDNLNESYDLNLREKSIKNILRKIWKKIKKD